MNIPIRVFVEYPFLHDFTTFYSSILFFICGLGIIFFARKKWKIMGFILILISIVWFDFVMRTMQSKNNHDSFNLNRGDILAHGCFALHQSFTNLLLVLLKRLLNLHSSYSILGNK